MCEIVLDNILVLLNIGGKHPQYILVARPFIPFVQEQKVVVV